MCSPSPGFSIALRDNTGEIKQTDMSNYIKTGLILTMQAFKDELRAIFKDTGALLILFLALIIYPVIYGIAYKKEVLRELPVAVVDLDRTSSGRLLMRMIDATEEMHVVSRPASMAEAEQLFYRSEVNGVILIPSGFERSLMKGEQATVSIYSDAGYFLMYKQTLSGTMQSAGFFGAGVEIKRYMAKGYTPEQAFVMRDPVSLKAVTLYNPSGGYNTFIMPGLLIVLVQQTLLIGIGLLGGTGKEQGRAKFAVPRSLKPGGVVSVVAGKAGAYFALYTVNIIITQVWVYHWFNLPHLTHLTPALALAVPFLLAVIFLGLALSTLFARREHSILFVVFLSPIVLFLTGLSWPTAAIPSWLNAMAHILPTTVMVPAWLRVRTMGAELRHIEGDVVFLIVQAVIYFALAVAFYYRASRKNRMDSK